MLRCLRYCSFYIEPRIFISNSYENWDQYVCAKYRTVSESYQEAKKLIFQIYISTVADESILKPMTICKFPRRLLSSQYKKKFRLIKHVPVLGFNYNKQVHIKTAQKNFK